MVLKLCLLSCCLYAMLNMFMSPLCALKAASSVPITGLGALVYTHISEILLSKTFNPSLEKFSLVANNVRQLFWVSLQSSDSCCYYSNWINVYK